MKRVLIVDDAATVRMYYRHALEEMGVEVEEAVNGIEALEKGLLAPFDLYIVDINMPKLDGYGFLREIRSRSIAQVPAIMVSTEASKSDQAQAFASGANLYFTKPVKPDQLRTCVGLLLGELRP
jgi:two-component system chemotaxis response regulator CheY